MLHHGTILFDVDLSFVADVLNVKPDKIKSKGIKSTRSRVTNIKPYLEEDISMTSFKLKLLRHLLGTEDVSKHVYELSDDDLDKIYDLMEKRYKKWGWNYGESPDYTLEKTGRYPGGKLEFLLNVSEGRIKDVKIYGDFLGSRDIGEFENVLKNTYFEEHSIRKAIQNQPLDEYFFNITEDDVIHCLFH